MKRTKIVNQLSRLAFGVVLSSLSLVSFTAAAADAAPAKSKPNILVIFGDDIGITNISKYSHGLMGYSTPNIDRLGNEGMMFTDYYGEQSCTAGRAAFITGQSPLRTGLTKVGIPGAKAGLQKEDPTLAELLKPMGYMTGQFGKNHLGDRDEYLPTEHGFDEFLGNLYHLSAEESPEDPDFPKDPAVAKLIMPRGIIRSVAGGQENADEELSKLGRVDEVDKGKVIVTKSGGKVQDIGPLTKKRMETIDQDFVDATLRYMDKAHKAKKPFFIWFNSTRMHYYTHIADKEKGLSGQGFYNDGMVAHDAQIGQLLKKLDDLKIADNTIVIYTTDNGVHYNQWPDAGITPFRGEKNTNWEGGFRVPAFIRWPGHIKADTVSNDMMSAQDWVPTLMAAAGVPDIKEKLLKGYSADNKKFNVHLDGYNFLPFLEGKVDKGPRHDFIYFSDDGKLLAIRDGDWKLVFAEQRAHGFAVWRDPFVDLRIPKVYNLRRDPYERADTDSNSYNVWWERKVQIVATPAMLKVQKFLMTFKKYPQRQHPDSFNVDQVVQQLLSPAKK